MRGGLRGKERYEGSRAVGKFTQINSATRLRKGDPNERKLYSRVDKERR